MIFLPSCFILLSINTALRNVVAVPQRRQPTVCNGSPLLCNRSYGNVTFAGAHDSYAFSGDPLDLSADQEVDLDDQLNRGIRLLQAQGHMKDGVLHFCHTSMGFAYILYLNTMGYRPIRDLFDGGTVADYLDKVFAWSHLNAADVLTLLFTNPERVDVTVWEEAFRSSGVANLAYIPPESPVKQSDWPPLSDFIHSGDRVVVFMDAGSDTTRVPYILPEFDMIWETPFDVTDASFPCSVNRIGGPLTQTDHMNLLNHYLDEDVLGILIPERRRADDTNGVDSIMNDVIGCRPFNGGRNPNFLLFDWVNDGNIIQVVNELNGV